jgi:undecaprenyl-diphosphatase
MSNLVAILILAVVQGVAEFLPISSSGHLVVLGYFLGIKDAAPLSIFLHAGTLLAIVVYYLKQLHTMTKRESRHTVGLLLLASIPAGIIGLSLKYSGLNELLCKELAVTAIGFIITGWILLAGIKSKENNTVIKDISVKQGLLIGLAQGVAILPGISRSGATIATALRCGIKKEDCAEFSFLLAIPAIAGAALLEIISLLNNTVIEKDYSHYINLSIGFAVSAVVGYISLTLLVKLLQRGKLQVFAWYLFALGAGLLIWRIWIII